MYEILVTRVRLSPLTLRVFGVLPVYIERTKSALSEGADDFFCQTAIESLQRKSGEVPSERQPSTVSISQEIRLRQGAENECAPKLCILHFNNV